MSFPKIKLPLNFSLTVIQCFVSFSDNVIKLAVGTMAELLHNHERERRV